MELWGLERSLSTRALTAPALSAPRPWLARVASPIDHMDRGGLKALTAKPAASAKNILLAIDLSDESQQVVDKALAIAGVGDHRSGHVVRPIEHVYGGFGAVGLAGDFSEQMGSSRRRRTLRKS